MATVFNVRVRQFSPPPGIAQPSGGPLTLGVGVRRSGGESPRDGDRLRRERIGGGDQLTTIAGEVLRFAEEREHHRREIVRTKPIDDPTRDQLRRVRHAVVRRRHPIVHDDDDDAAQIELVGGDVGADLPHPFGGDRRGRGDVDGRERDDRLRLAVFEHREVLGAQAVNRLAVLVEHRDVEPDEIDAGAEGLLGLGGLRRLRVGMGGCETTETRSTSRRRNRLESIERSNSIVCHPARREPSRTGPRRAGSDSGRGLQNPRYAATQREPALAAADVNFGSMSTGTAASRSRTFCTCGRTTPSFSISVFAFS